VKPFRFVIVDVFTDRALTGNQLAVFTDARDIPEELLQPLAREMGFSETVFVYPAAAGGDAMMRIFTPATEVPFAGHPTLGTAFVLGAPLQSQVIRLETGRGIVPVELEREGARIVFGRMEQPLPTVELFQAEQELLAAIGVNRSELPVEVYDNGIQHVYVCLSSPDAVASPLVASPPTAVCDCLLAWWVPFRFPAHASPEPFAFDCSRSPVLQCQATQTGTAALTGSTCTAVDRAEDCWDVLFTLDADCDWSTSPPSACPLRASPEPQQPAPPVVASPVEASPPTPD